VNADLDLRLVGPLLGADADVHAIYTDAAGRKKTPWDLAAIYRHVPAQEALEARVVAPIVALDLGPSVSMREPI
jgi:hypothetical protein